MIYYSGPVWAYIIQKAELGFVSNALGHIVSQCVSILTIPIGNV